MLLTGMIWSMSKNPKGCRASNKYFASVIGVHQTQIKKVLKVLVKKGLIYRELGHGKRKLEINSNHRTLRGSSGPRPLYTTYKANRNHPKIRFTPFDLECTKILKLNCEKNSKPAIWRNKDEARYFKDLRKVIKDPDYLLDVLEWYCSHLKRPSMFKLPTCTSPKEFRNQWNWINERYQKSDEFKNRPIPLSPLAQQILKSLHKRTWPKGSKEQLANAVQLSLTDYTDFKDRLKNTKFSTRLQSIVNYLVKKLPSPSTFIEVWFLQLHDNVVTWERWAGDLDPYRFSVDSKKFNQQMKGLVASYCGDPYPWNLIKAELNEG
jgi:hypothetical protein